MTICMCSRDAILRVYVYHKSIFKNKRDQWLEARVYQYFMGCLTFLSKATAFHRIQACHMMVPWLCFAIVNSLVLCGTVSIQSNAQSLDFVGSSPVDCVLKKAAADCVFCGCIPRLGVIFSVVASCGRSVQREVKQEFAVWEA